MVSPRDRRPHRTGGACGGCAHLSHGDVAPLVELIEFISVLLKHVVVTPLGPCIPAIRHTQDDERYSPFLQHFPSHATPVYTLKVARHAGLVAYLSTSGGLLFLLLLRGLLGKARHGFNTLGFVVCLVVIVCLVFTTLLV